MRAKALWRSVWPFAQGKPSELRKTSAKPGHDLRLSNAALVVRSWLAETGKPLAANPTAGLRMSLSGSRLGCSGRLRSACQPRIVPGTVTAASAPRGGIASKPRDLNKSTVARPAACPQASTPTGAQSFFLISQKLSPPTAFICGYTTARLAAVATAASSAVPPASRICRPV